MLAHEVLQRVWQDNQRDIEQHANEPGMRLFVDGLATANARIRAAMAGLSRGGASPAMSSADVDAWVKQAADQQTTRPDAGDAGRYWPGATHTTQEVPKETPVQIEGEVLPPLPNNKPTDGAPR